MDRRSKGWGRALLTAVLLATAGAAAAESNKWRLECDGNAKAAGTIVLALQAPDEEARQATIAIADGTTENMVAQAIVDALRAQSTGERFTAERDDGEDVLIKKRYGQPDFTVTVVSNDVAGVSIDVERE